MRLKNIDQSKKLLMIANFVLLFTLIFSLGSNQILIVRISKALNISSNPFKQVTDTIVKKTNFTGSARADLSGNIINDVIKLAISQGVPKIYGEELGVSFDAVQQSINIMKQYDPTYGQQKIVLAGDDLKRYIDVGLKISCEYCCSAKSIIREDGMAACGCAHSWAMRGLAAYLIQNHGSQYTNDEVLRELARWKAMYFPKQMIQKMATQFRGASFTPDIASLVLGVNLPDYGQGSQGAPLPSDIKNLPSMIGGC